MVNPCWYLFELCVDWCLVVTGGSVVSMTNKDLYKREADWDKKHAEFVKGGMTGKEAYIAANKWEEKLKEAKTCQSKQHSLTL